MPLVMGSPWVGGYFGSAEVGITATGNLANRVVVEATIWVRAGGGQDHTTIQAAVDVAVAADVIEVEADTPGGSQTFAESLLITSSGAAGQYIILRPKAGDTIMVTSPTSTSTLRFTAAAYWDIGNFTFGDESQWTPTSTSNPSGYTPQRQLDAGSSSHHLKFRTATFTGGSSVPLSNRLTSSCHHIYFDTCKFWKHGTNFDQRTAPKSDAGDLLLIQADNVYMKNCSAFLGGHELVSFLGSWCRVEHSTFNNNGWVAVHGDSRFPGARAAEISPGKTKDGADSPYGHLSMRWCDFVIPGASQENGNVNDNICMKLEGKFITLYDSIIYSIAGTPGNKSQGTFHLARPANVSDLAFCESNRIYHNTIDDVDKLRSGSDDQHYDGAKTGGDHIFKNNVCGALALNACLDYNWGKTSDGHGVTFNDDNGWLDNNHVGNIFDTPGTPVARTEPVNGAGFVSNDLPAAAESAWPNNFSANQAATPVFVDSSLRTRAGYALSSGAGVGDAEPITTMSGAGSSSINITLADSLYFFCAAEYDIAEFGAESDYISIGGNAAVQILTLDYDTGIGTISSAQSWSNGANVALVAEDTTTVMDDIGIKDAA